jgi:hypothetical protein
MAKSKKEKPIIIEEEEELPLEEECVEEES